MQTWRVCSCSLKRNFRTHHSENNGRIELGVWPPKFSSDAWRTIKDAQSNSDSQLVRYQASNATWGKKLFVVYLKMKDLHHPMPLRYYTPNVALANEFDLLLRDLMKYFWTQIWFAIFFSVLTKLGQTPDQVKILLVHLQQMCKRWQRLLLIWQATFWNFALLPIQSRKWSKILNQTSFLLDTFFLLLEELHPPLRRGWRLKPPTQPSN